MQAPSLFRHYEPFACTKKKKWEKTNDLLSRKIGKRQTDEQQWNQMTSWYAKVQKIIILDAPNNHREPQGWLKLRRIIKLFSLKAYNYT